MGARFIAEKDNFLWFKKSECKGETKGKKFSAQQQVLLLGKNLPAV
jgi:hypothetical protein